MKKRPPRRLPDATVDTSPGVAAQRGPCPPRGQSPDDPPSPEGTAPDRAAAGLQWADQAAADRRSIYGRTTEEAPVDHAALDEPPQPPWAIPQPRPRPDEPRLPVRLPPAVVLRRRDRTQRWRGVLVVVGLLLSLVIATRLLASVGPDGGAGADGPSADQQGQRTFDRSPPAAAPAVGSLVQTTIGDDGAVRVSQWIRAPQPLSEIDLGLPQVYNGDGDARASDLTVAAGDEVVDEGGSVGADGARYTFDAPASTVFLGYTLDGVLDRSPSVPGRALVRAIALDVGPDAVVGPTRATINASSIRSVACVPADTDLPRPCGVRDAGSWTVVLRGQERSDSVIAQVDLP